MSMLVRKGTMVRAKRGTVKKSSTNRPRPTGTGKEVSRGLEDVDDSSVVSTPVKHEGEARPLDVVADQTSTVVCFDANRELYQTSVRWPEQTTSTDQAAHGEFFLQIREANKEADSTADFLCRFSDLFCNTLFVTVCIVVLLLVPTIMVSVGVKYLGDCPRQPKIPVYLLVGGCFGVLKLTGLLYKNIQIRRYESMDAFYDAHDSDAAFASHTFKLMDAMLSTFLLAWQITGTYWVFSIWEPHYHQLLHEPSNWCEKNVYMCAVIQITGCYFLMCLGVIVLVLVGLCYKFTGFFDK